MFHHVLSIKIWAPCNSLKRVNEGKEIGKRRKEGDYRREGMDGLRCGKAKSCSDA